MSGLFRANTLLPRSLRSTAGCQWSYMIAQPALVTSSRSVLACTSNLSTLQAAKPCCDQYEDEMSIEQIKERISMLIRLFVPSAEWSVMNSPSKIFQSR
jgi:hypothetical protein